MKPIVLDANQAQELAALMRQANDITARAVDEDAHVRACADWMAERTLDGRLTRELTDEGTLEWVVLIDVGARGTVRRWIPGPEDWYEAVATLGLD